MKNKKRNSNKDIFNFQTTKTVYFTCFNKIHMVTSSPFLEEADSKRKQKAQRIKVKKEGSYHRKDS